MAWYAGLMEAYSNPVTASNRDNDCRIVQQEESTASHGVRNPLLSRNWYVMYRKWQVTIKSLLRHSANYKRACRITVCAPVG